MPRKKPAAPDAMPPKIAAIFAEYCAMGIARSFYKVAALLRQKYPQHYTGTETTIVRRLERWSVQYDWQTKVKEHDAIEIRERQKKREAEVERMNDEHAVFGRTQAMRAISMIDELIKNQKLGSQAAVQLFKYATDLERLARGEAISEQQQKHAGEVRIVIEQDAG